MIVEGEGKWNAKEHRVLEAWLCAYNNEETSPLRNERDEEGVPLLDG